MVTGLGNKADENSENFNKETETIEKHQSEIKNITEMKKCTRGIQKQVCRGRRFCKLNNRTMEIVESEEQEEK